MTFLSRLNSGTRLFLALLLKGFLCADVISIDGFDYQKIHGDNDCYHCALNLKCKILGKVLSECEKDPKKRDFIFQRVEESESEDVDWTPLLEALLALRGELAKENQAENGSPSSKMTQIGERQGPVTAGTLWSATKKTDEDLARDELEALLDRGNRYGTRPRPETAEIFGETDGMEPAKWSIESETAIVAGSIDRLSGRIGEKLDQIHADLAKIIALLPK